MQYELEHEKLAMELEEERRTHKEREQCIRDQQMKIDNLSSLVTFSGPDQVEAFDATVFLFFFFSCFCFQIHHFSVILCLVG